MLRTNDVTGKTRPEGEIQGGGRQINVFFCHFLVFGGQCRKDKPLN